MIVPFKKFWKYFQTQSVHPGQLCFQGAACQRLCQQEMQRDLWRTWRMGNAARRFLWAALSVLGSCWVGMDTGANAKPRKQAGAVGEFSSHHIQSSKALPIVSLCHGLTASPSPLLQAGSAHMRPGCEIEMLFGKHNIILIINYLEMLYRNSSRSLLPEGCFCSQSLYQLLSGNWINIATKMQTVVPLIKRFGIS